MNRLEQAMISSGNSIDKLRNCQSAIESAIDRLFPDGCPREAGPLLGAYNMLCNANGGIDEAIYDIGNARTHLIAEIDKDAPIPEELSWMK